MKTYRNGYKVNLGLGIFFLMLSGLNLIINNSSFGLMVTLMLLVDGIIRFRLAFKHQINK